MLITPTNQLLSKSIRLIVAHTKYTHSKTCPAQTTNRCPGASSSTPGSSIKKLDFKRAEKSAPCRLGFLPDDWFVFFHSKTGVTGPYIFGIVFCNYMLSKEKYVLEHEFYSGLSVALICYILVTQLGPAFATYLDGECAKVENMLKKGRQNEIDVYEKSIKISKELQWRAEGQKQLIDARKECIAIQLEAAYRQRLLEVYDAVKGRLEYQIKKNRLERRIHQKWLVQWVLDQVYKSITDDFKKKSLEKAIQDLANRPSILSK